MNGIILFEKLWCQINTKFWGGIACKFEKLGTLSHITVFLIVEQWFLTFHAVLLAIFSDLYASILWKVICVMHFFLSGFLFFFLIGVFTIRSFETISFVLQYPGDFITKEEEEADGREKCKYIYFYDHQKNTIW